MIRTISYFSVELVVTKIKEFIDRSERFEIDQNLFFTLAVITEDGTTIDDKTIVRSFIVKLQSYWINYTFDFFLLSLAEVMAVKTDFLFTEDLMLEAVPNSCVNMLETSDICFLGGRINEIILVPLLNRLMNHKNDWLPLGGI